MRQGQQHNQLLLKVGASAPARCVVYPATDILALPKASRHFLRPSWGHNTRCPHTQNNQGTRLAVMMSHFATADGRSTAATLTSSTACRPCATGG